jgi:hypothetical protein
MEVEIGAGRHVEAWRDREAGPRETRQRSGFAAYRLEPSGRIVQRHHQW